MKQYKLAINGNRYTVKILGFDQETVSAEVNGTMHSVAIEDIENLTIFGDPVEEQQPQPTAAATTNSSNVGQKRSAPIPAEPSVFGSDNVIAPIPGQIIAINVTQGQKVQKGQPVLVLEAMKMENIITAKRDGVIADVCVAVGEAVTQNQLLISMA